MDFRRARLVTRNGESCDEVVLVNLMQGLRQASLKTTASGSTTLVRVAKPKIEIVDEHVDFRRARLVTRNGESCDEVVLVNLMQGLRQASLKTSVPYQWFAT